LEPLYEASIKRMEIFVDEATKGKLKFFEETLAHVKSPEHPNLQYFIFKSIILNTLYGVDIMKEAVEIAKLRLFLKLVATVDADYRKPNLGLEPLPDVDFNIRSGNTLIGYASEKDLHKAFEGRLDYDRDEEKIKEKCDVVAHAFARYKEIQLGHGDDYQHFKEAKEALNERLKVLHTELNTLLHKQAYGKITYNKWLATHQPFHWLAEFYEIIHNKGGFDLIVGNPPYVELSSLRDYVVRGFTTIPCGNLYCPVIERSISLTSNYGLVGMIVPLSLSCTERMNEVRTVIEENFSHTWISHFSGDANPSKLFDGVKSRLDIVIGQRGQSASILSSPYMKWFADERTNLFSKITYASVSNAERVNGLIPKSGTPSSSAILRKLMTKKPVLKLMDNSNGTIYVHRVITMWVKCFDFVPYFRNAVDGVKKSDDYKPYSFHSEGIARTVLASINSSIFFYYFITLGDCFHCGKEFVSGFPLNPGDFNTLTVDELAKLTKQLMENLKKTSIRRKAVSGKTGSVEYDEFWPRYSKPIIDEIDTILATHYGFTPEELDFIINYDIKYRMGKELEGDE
jgi:hypothetical protein